VLNTPRKAAHAAGKTGLDISSGGSAQTWAFSAMVNAAKFAPAATNLPHSPQKERNTIGLSRTATRSNGLEGTG